MSKRKTKIKQDRLRPVSRLLSLVITCDKQALVPHCKTGKFRGWWNGVHVRSELPGMLVHSYVYVHAPPGYLYICLERTAHTRTLFHRPLKGTQKTKMSIKWGFHITKNRTNYDWMKWKKWGIITNIRKRSDAAAN